MTKSNNSVGKLRMGIGPFGYVLHDPLPEAFANHLAPYSKVISGTPEEVRLAHEMGFIYLTADDISGVYYVGQIIEILVEIGFELYYLDRQVVEESDIARINASNEHKPGSAV